MLQIAQREPDLINDGGDLAEQAFCSGPAEILVHGFHHRCIARRVSLQHFVFVGHWTVTLFEHASLEGFQLLEPPFNRECAVSRKSGPELSLKGCEVRDCAAI